MLATSANKQTLKLSRNMKKILLILIGASFLSILVHVILQQRSQALSNEATYALVSLRHEQITKQFQVEIAQTVEDQTRGLSGRSALKPGEGMLFKIDPPAVTGFWMYKMSFPLDIIWIKGGRVVGTSLNLPVPDSDTPADLLPVYYPPSEIDYALEVNAGEADIFKAGDYFTLL